jgi:hypothetical protein
MPLLQAVLRRSRCGRRPRQQRRHGQGQFRAAPAAPALPRRGGGGRRAGRALRGRAGWPGRLLQVPGRLFRTHRRQWPGPSASGGSAKNDSAKNDSGRAAVSDLAVKDGASDKGKLEACLRSDDTLGRIAAEGDSAEAADVEGTPAVALRNNLTGETILVNGAIDPDTLDQGIALMARRGLRHAAPPPDYAR